MTDQTIDATPSKPIVGTDADGRLNRVDMAARLQETFSDGPAYGSGTWLHLADAFLDLLDADSPKAVRSGSWRDLPIDALKTPTAMPVNTLRTNACRTVGEVADLTDSQLLCMPQMGRKSLVEVRTAIAEVRGYSRSEITRIAAKHA